MADANDQDFEQEWVGSDEEVEDRVEGEVYII
jgi:hypothetical protein